MKMVAVFLFGQQVVNIKATIWDKAQEENYPFRLQISIVGHFSASEKLTHDENHLVFFYH
jgi:hypothetical protein